MRGAKYWLLKTEPESFSIDDLAASPEQIAGTARVVREAYPDHTAWRKGDPHFDAKASPDNPIWLMVQPVKKSEFDAIMKIARSAKRT